MKQQNPQITIREMDSARSMEMQLKEIPKYELITENYLFDGDYTTKTKQKHALVNTLGKLINFNILQFLKYWNEQTILLGDSVFVTGRLSSKIIYDFDLSLNTINNICNHNTLNIKYYIYMESWLKPPKETEESKKDAIETINTKLQSPIPVQVQWFCSRFLGF